MLYALSRWKGERLLQPMRAFFPLKDVENCDTSSESSSCDGVELTRGTRRDFRAERNAGSAPLCCL